MQEIQRTVQGFLDNHQKKKKYIFILVALSFLVVIFVTISLIMPAVSETGTLSCNIDAHTHDSSCYDENGNLICGLDEHIHSEECYSLEENVNVQTGINNVFSNLSYAFNLVGDGNPYSMNTGIENSLVTVTQSAASVGYDEKNYEKQLIQYNVEFNILGSVFIDGKISKTQPCMTYQIPNDTMKKLLIESPYNGVPFKGSNNEEAGTFSVTTSGLMTFTFNNDYLVNNWLKLTSYSTEFTCTGYAEFEAWATRDANSTSNVKFGNSEIKFPSSEIKLNKSASISSDGNKIIWSITINNPRGLNLENLYITDDAFTSGTTATYTDASHTTATSVDSSLGTFSDGKFTFNSNTSSNITLSYSTDLSGVDLKDINSNGVFSNTAKIYSKDATDTTEPLSEDTATLDIQPVTLEKSGCGDNNNGRAEWIITIKNHYHNLNGYIIEDDMLSKNLEGVSINPINCGSYVDGKVTLSEDTINNDTITITYKTDFVDTNTTNPFGSEEDYIKNTATLTKGEKEITSNEASVKYNKIYFTKSGNANNDGTVTWTLNISNPSHLDLGGYTIQDDAFKTATNTNFDSSIGTLDSTNGILTLSSTNSDNIQITYTNELKDCLPTGTNELSLTGGTVTNTATIKDDGTGDGHSTNATGNATYNGITFYKNGTQPDADGNITWTITIYNPNHLNIGGHTIVDDNFDKVVTIKNGDTDVLSNLNKETNTYTIPDNITGDYTLTYTTNVTNYDNYNNSTDGKVTITNNATLKNGESIIKEFSANVSVSGNVGITKSYQFDYNYNGNVDNKVYWTVTVTANNGTNLNGKTIEDAKINLSNVEKIIVNGTEEVSKEVYNDTRWTISSDSVKGGSVKVNSNTIRSLTIIYTTEYNSSGDNNTASVDGVSTGEISYSGDSYQPYTIDKSNNTGENGTDIKNRQVEWYITVTNNGGQASLDGMVIEDDMFDSNLMVGDISIDNGVGFDYVTDINGTTTSTGKTNFIKLKNTNSASSVTIKYTTTAESGLHSNTATYKKGDFTGSDTSRYTYTAKNEIIKGVGDFTHNTSSKNNPRDDGTINWNIVVNKDAGFQNATITDNMSCDSDVGATHTITQTQLDAMTIMGSKSNAQGTTYDTDLSSYCTTTLGKDGKSFTITFDENVPTDIISVKVEYDTTATIENLKTNRGLDIKFTNSATTNGNNTPYSAEKTTKTFNPDDIPFKKYALSDMTSKNILDDNSTRKLSDLPTFTDSNGKKHYIFTWTISLDLKTDETGKNKFSNSSLIQLNDILPTGFSLYTDTYNNIDYSPKTVWGDNIYNINLNDTNNNQYYLFDSNSNKITFASKSNGSSFKYLYSAEISEDDLEDIYFNGSNQASIPNTVTTTDANWSGCESTNTQTITKGVIDTDNGLINKTVTPQEGGTFKYTVDVNPEGKVLSTDGYILITDNFKVTDYNLHDVNSNPIDVDLDSVEDKFSISLNNLKIYEANADGSKGRQLTSNEYSSSTSLPKTTWETEVFNGTFEEVTKNGKYNLNNISLKNGYKVTLTFDSILSDTVINDLYFYYQDNYGNIAIKFGKTINTGWGINYKYDYKNDTTNNKTIFTITIPQEVSSQNCLQMESWSKNLPDNFSCNVEITKPVIDDFTRSMQLTVPDGKHLIFEYDYSFTRKDSLKVKGDTVTAKNDVSLSTSYYSSSSSKEESVQLYSRASGGIYTKGFPRIVKYDVNNYTITNLVAKFKIAKWDSTNNKWLYAKTMDTNAQIEKKTTNAFDTTAENQSDAIELSTTGGSYNIKLDDGTMYKIIEVTPPIGYMCLDRPVYFTYGTVSNEVTTSAIQDDISKATSLGYNFNGISVNDVKITNLNETDCDFKLPNYQSININVRKEWNSTDHESDSVLVQLYKSNTKAMSGFPKDLTLVQDITLNSANNWTTTIENLPSGDIDGNPIYYYVKEYSYTIGNKIYTISDDGKYKSGTEVGIYTPSYTGNAVNENGSIIEVLNSSEIIVEKEWRDFNNNVIPTETATSNDNTKIPESIQVQVYRDGSPYKTITLSKTNGWKSTLNTTDYPLTDGNGNTYKYTFEEITNLSDYDSSVLGEINGQVGKVKLVNKYTKTPESFLLEVSKQWTDGANRHANDTVTLELHRVDSSKTPNNDEVIETITLNTQNEWKWASQVYTYLVTNTGGYDEEVIPPDGIAKTQYQYYFVETSVVNKNNPETNNISNYEITYNGDTSCSRISKSSESHSVVVNNKSNSIKLITLNIQKVWSGFNNVPIPNSIQYEVYQSDKADSPESEWELVYTGEISTANYGKPTKIDYKFYNFAYYHIKEVSVEGANYTTTYTYTPTSGTASEYNPTTGINADGSITITNTYSEPTKIAINIEKEWDDKNQGTDYRPESVSFDLIRSTVELTSEQLGTISSTSVTVNPDSFASVTVDGVSGDISKYTTAISIPDGETSTKVSKLPAKDTDGNQYYYYVVEKEVTNYTNTSVKNITYKVDDKDVTYIKGAGGTIKFTNTLDTTSLRVQKSWLDKNGNDISGDEKVSSNSVKVQLYRSTEKVTQNNSGNTSLTDNIFIAQNSTASYLTYILTTTSPNWYNWLGDSNGIVSVNDNKTFSIDDVSKIEVILNNSDTFNISNQNENTYTNFVKSEARNGTLTFIKNENNNFIITGSDFNNNIKEGSSLSDYKYLYAWGSYDIKYYVNPPKFTVNATGCYDETNKCIEVAEGSSITLTFANNTNNVTAISTSNSITGSVDKTNKTITIQGISVTDGTITLSVKDGDTEKFAIPVKVVAPSDDPITATLPSSAEKVGDPITISKSNNNWTVEISNLVAKSPDGTPYYYYIEEVSNAPGYFTSSYNHGITLEGENPTVSVTNKESNIITLSVQKKWLKDGEDNSSQHNGDTIYFVVCRTVENQEPTIDTTNFDTSNPSDALVFTDNISNVVRLTASDNWVKSFANLDVNYYYYWVYEVNTSNAYDVTYNNNGASLSSGSQTLTIVNTSIDTSTVLPSTGGTGTMKYYVIGGGIVAISTIMLVKRRRDFK